MKGDLITSMELLRKAETLDPKNLDVQFYIGLTQYFFGNMSGAEEILRNVLAAEPKYVDAKIVLGRVLTAQGKLPESEKLLREAIIQTPKYIDAYEALSTNLIAQKRLPEALQILDQGLAQEKNNAELLIKKGKLLFIMKEPFKAQAVADELMSHHDVNAQYTGNILRAQIQFDANPVSIDAANYYLFRAIDISPEKEEAYLILADIYASSWKFVKAKQLLNDSLTSVSNKEKIRAKIDEMDHLKNEVTDFQISFTGSRWEFDDARAGWQEFYLDGVWRIDPYKTLVMAVESFSRDTISDQTLRLEYIMKLNKWVYVYTQARHTVDPEFREKNGFKAGANFVTNPLKIGSTVLTTEVDNRNYIGDKVYFITAGVEQYIGSDFIVNAKIFHVMTGDQNFNVWNAKLSYQVNPKLQVNAGYGTMTESLNGRLMKGNSYNLGAEYKVNNRVSIVGNYTRHTNELYKADQFTVGVKVNFKKR